MKAWAVFLAVPVLFFLFPSQSRAQTITKRLADGVSLVQEVDTDPPLAIDVLVIDPARPGVRIETTLGQDTVTGPTGDIHKGRESVSEAAIRHGAIAAVNGDFFPFTGDPLGVGITNGRLYSEPYGPGRDAVGVSADGKTLLFDILSYLGDLQAADGARYAIAGVDRMVSGTDLSDLVVFTPDYGPSSGGRMGGTEVVLGNVNLPLRINQLMKGTVRQVIQNASVATPIPEDGVVLSAPPGGPAAAYLDGHYHVGDEVEFLCAVAPKPDIDDAVKLALAPAQSGGLPSRAGEDLNRRVVDWSAVSQAIGGGPHLVVNGQVSVDSEQEGFDESFTNDPNPRTAIGQMADGRIILVTVDGRQKLSRGVSLLELAQIMRKLGAVNAMNLDGGGSTTMAADGLVVNWPSGTGDERPVADMLLVYGPRPSDPRADREGDLPPLTIVAPANPIQVGESAKLIAKQGTIPLEGSDPDLVWAGVATNGVGVVTQDGVFHAVKPGTGTIKANDDGREAEAQITVAGPAPAAASYTLTAELSPAPSHAPNRSNLVVRIVDSSGMPLANAAVHVAVTGGIADSADITTGADGTATTAITWQSNSGVVTATSGALKPATASYSAPSAPPISK